MTAALALCRFIHFLAAMLAFGASLYLWLCASPRLRAALRPLLHPVRLAAAVALAAALAWLALEAAAMAGDPWAAADPGVLAAVLTDTAFGPAWIVHFGFAALAVVAVWRPGAGWGAIAASAGLSLASLALVGHAAMQVGAEGLLHRGNDAVHLLAAGIWIGGLPAFLANLRASRDPSHSPAAVRAMMRFSTLGHFAVAALVLTGIVNAALTGGWPLPPATPYRALLDAKIAIAVVMICLAIVNRYALAPRLPASPGALAALRTITIVNLGFGAGVVALAAVCGLLDPGESGGHFSVS